MQTQPAGNTTDRHTPGIPLWVQLNAISPNLLNALSATQPLHPKQLALLVFLNQHRDSQHPHLTIPLSYQRIHAGTGISTEHIRRGALPRLLRNGLISVLSQSFSGTIYQLRFDHPTLEGVVTHRRERPSEPLLETGPPTTLQEPSAQIALQDEITRLRQFHEQRHALRRESFAASLTPDQIRWIIDRAKQSVDAQEGIRFVKDRFPQYEAARLTILDEWLLRHQYGEQIPAMPHIEGDPQ